MFQTCKGAPSLWRPGRTSVGCPRQPSQYTGVVTKAVFLLSALCLTCLAPGAQSQVQNHYFRTLARDTWLSIDDLVEPETGLPYDSADMGDFTSVSNIGIYLTCLVSAEELGFISKAESSKRADKTLASLAKLRTQFGFNQCWNGVKTLQPGTNDAWISVLDSGNLIAGLISLAESHPDQKVQAMKLAQAHDWKAFWDEDQKALLGGWSFEKKDFNRQWHLDTLGTDAALAQFFAVSSGAAPAGFWKGLNRRQIEWEGEKFLWPGWEGGGLFMQFISGLWLPLKGSELGNSGAAFARAQVKHAKALPSPVWGWSACCSPEGGYLGWGALKDEVVTPHASVLAVDLMPEAVMQNLQELEKLGVRSPSRGFYDSVNWRSRKVCQKMLILDQGMILISLANHLRGGVIRQRFAGSELVKKGLSLAG